MYKNKKRLGVNSLVLMIFLIISFSAVSWFQAPVAEAKGKTFVTGTPDQYGEWDPARVSGPESFLALNLYEPLLYNNPPGSGEPFTPALATEWSLSDDKLTWTFKIRKGVKFHDGEPLNAVAVKNSIDRVIQEKVMGYIWPSVKEIKAVDEYTVQFLLKFPAPINLIASAQFGAIICSPKAAANGTEWFNKGNEAGTGPFLVRDYIKGQQIILDKNPDYWGGADSVYFDRVIIKITQDTSTRVQMLRSGEADWIYPIPPDVLKTMEGDEGIALGAFPSTRNKLVFLHNKRYPTNNKKFRQALTHIWDYAGFVENVYHGFAQVNEAPIPTAIWGANTNLDMPRFDLDRARKLLDESGVPPEDRKITLSYFSNREEDMNNCILFQEIAAKVGVKVECDSAAFPILWGKMKDPKLASHMLLTIWPVSYPTPSDLLYSGFRSEDPAFWNLGHYSNPAFDKVLDEAISLEGTDRDASIVKYHEAQKILVDDAAGIFYCSPLKLVAYSSSLRNVITNPAYYPPFFKVFSRSE